MIRGLKSYPAYKDSGVPWLGEVPEHWEARKLRHVLRQVTVRNRPNLPLLSVVREKGVILRDVSNGDENHNFIPDDLSNYKVVCSGQFAMNKMKAWQGSYGVSRHDGIVSPAYFVLDIAGVGGDYFHAAMRSKAYVPFFTQASDGVRIGQWDLSQARMREVPFFVPPLPEQAGIVRFLDHVDRRIRRYVRTKQKLIVLLNEQKQAIIHRAVTRGLDPDVRFKPSGVEWLGDVPESWRVLRVKDLARLRSGDSITSLTISDTGRYPVYGGNNVRGFTSAYTHEGEFVLIGRQGALCGNINYAKGQFWASEHAVVAHPRQSYDLIWFGELLRTMNLNQYSVSAAQPGLSVERIENLQLPVPPTHEQSRIAHYLETAAAGPKGAVAFAHKEIALLREFRTRLIADVVTGKLDVREAATRLPVEAEEPELLNDAGALAEDISEETEATDLDAALEEAEA